MYSFLTISDRDCFPDSELLSTPCGHTSLCLSQFKLSMMHPRSGGSGVASLQDADTSEDSRRLFLLITCPVRQIEVNSKLEEKHFQGRGW